MPPFQRAKPAFAAPAKTKRGAPAPISLQVEPKRAGKPLLLPFFPFFSHILNSFGPSYVLGTAVCCQPVGSDIKGDFCKCICMLLYHRCIYFGHDRCYAMYMQKYFDIVNYVRLYSSYLANKMHTEKIHVQYIYFTSNFVAVSARVWLIVVFGCSFVFFAYILYLHFSLRDLCSWDIIRLIQPSHIPMIPPS